MQEVRHGFHDLIFGSILSAPFSTVIWYDPPPLHKPASSIWLIYEISICGSRILTDKGVPLQIIMESQTYKNRHQILINGLQGEKIAMKLQQHANIQVIEVNWPVCPFLSELATWCQLLLCA